MSKDQDEKREEENLTTVKAYLKAFGEGVPDEMSKFLSDDAIFEIPGPESSAYSKHIEGKDNIHEFYQKRQEFRNKFITTTRVIPKFIKGKDHVIAEWTVEGMDKTNNQRFQSKGTNHFLLNEEGKIKHVKIYVNAPLDSSVKSLDEQRLLVSDQGKLALMAWSVV